MSQAKASVHACRRKQVSALQASKAGVLYGFLHSGTVQACIISRRFASPPSEGLWEALNARLYDPAVGRFLSPDPYIQDPMNSQNYNRYSYCLNNPLKYTDPSGEQYYYDYDRGCYVDDFGERVAWSLAHQMLFKDGYFRPGGPMSINTGYSSWIGGGYNYGGSSSSGFIGYGYPVSFVSDPRTLAIGYSYYEYTYLTGLNISEGWIPTEIGSVYVGLTNSEKAQLKMEQNSNFVQNYGERIFGQNSTDGFDMGRSRHLGPGIDNGGYWHVDLQLGLHKWLRGKTPSPAQITISYDIIVKQRKGDMVDLNYWSNTVDKDTMMDWGVGLNLGDTLRINRDSAGIRTVTPIKESTHKDVGNGVWVRKLPK